MQKKEWNEEFLRELSAGNVPKYPNEVMLKVVFGKYLDKPLKANSDWRVLDIGCAFGSNLIPFADMGCEIHGVDIHPEIALNATKVMHSRGYTNVKFQEGVNRKLPYPDNYFDLVLSINTLHYEGSRDMVLDALAEFERVLKPGGALYLSTVGPDHEIYKRSKLIDQHINLITNFGFRNGEEFFFFDNERYLNYFLSKYFFSVETGKVQEKLMTLQLI
jgi:ubiquinone/menaquinone biosynthesis C-methylase UbiE